MSKLPTHSDQIRRLVLSVALATWANILGSSVGFTGPKTGYDPGGLIINTEPDHSKQDSSAQTPAATRTPTIPIAPGLATQQSNPNSAVSPTKAETVDFLTSHFSNAVSRATQFVAATNTPNRYSWILQSVDEFKIEDLDGRIHIKLTLETNFNAISCWSTGCNGHNDQISFKLISFFMDESNVFACNSNKWRVSAGAVDTPGVQAMTGLCIGCQPGACSFSSEIIPMQDVALRDRIVNAFARLKAIAGTRKEPF